MTRRLRWRQRWTMNDRRIVRALPSRAPRPLESTTNCSSVSSSWPNCGSAEAVSRKASRCRSRYRFLSHSNDCDCFVVTMTRHHRHLRAMWLEQLAILDFDSFDSLSSGSVTCRCGCCWPIYCDDDDDDGRGPTRTIATCRRRTKRPWLETSWPFDDAYCEVWIWTTRTT